MSVSRSSSFEPLALSVNDAKVLRPVAIKNTSLDSRRVALGLNHLTLSNCGLHTFCRFSLPPPGPSRSLTTSEPPLRSTPGSVAKFSALKFSSSSSPSSSSSSRTASAPSPSASRTACSASSYDSAASLTPSPLVDGAMSLNTDANGRPDDTDPDFPDDVPGPDDAIARSFAGSRSKTSPVASVVRLGSTRGPSASARVAVRSTPSTAPLTETRSHDTWVQAPGWHPRSSTTSPLRITLKRSWISVSFSADLAAYPSFFASLAKKSAVLRDPMVTDGAPQPSDPSFGICKKLFGYEAIHALPERERLWRLS